LINFIGSVVTIALYCVLYWLLFLMLKKIDGAGNTFWYVYLPSGIYTSVVAVIMYFVLKPIKKKLNKEQNLI
jgi:uncharacterized membrane protein